MEIRILQTEELSSASGLSRYVFDVCVRNRMEFPQTISFVEEYISVENLKKLCAEEKLTVWGAFEGEQIVGVSGLQSDGMITMLYILPQCQNRGYGSSMLVTMRRFAKNEYGFDRVMVNANPAWTSFFFTKKGFHNTNAQQNMHVPFVPMYALSDNIDGFQKRPVSKKVIVLAVVGCILFATIVGSLYMMKYLFI